MDSTWTTPRWTQIPTPGSCAFSDVGEDLPMSKISFRSRRHRRRSNCRRKVAARRRRVLLVEHEHRLPLLGCVPCKWVFYLHDHIAYTPLDKTPEFSLQRSMWRANENLNCNPCNTDLCTPGPTCQLQMNSSFSHNSGKG